MGDLDGFFKLQARHRAEARADRAEAEATVLRERIEAALELIDDYEPMHHIIRDALRQALTGQPGPQEAA